jgi:hypothetical protein
MTDSRCGRGCDDSRILLSAGVNTFDDRRCLQAERPFTA